MDADYLVIGAGVVGMGVAAALLERGAKVTIIEKSDCGNESSWAGGGILSPLCPWDYPEAVTRLTTLGAQRFAAWAARLHAETGIDPEYLISGMRVLPPYDFARAQAWCEFHSVRMQQEQGSILLPDVAQVRNPRLMHALRRRIEMLGGHIIEQCEVLGINSTLRNVQSVQTSRGEIRAGQYILTAGAWSCRVLGAHALQLDIKPVRGQMLLFKFDAPPISQIMLKGDLYLIPRRDGCLLVGSTLEDVGFDKSVTDTAYTSLRSRAETLLPDLIGMPLQRHWAGLRPGSPNNVPTIGCHPELENLFINAGHFRYGVTMAPAAVELLLNELDGVSQPFDTLAYQAMWNGVT